MCFVLMLEKTTFAIP